MKLEEDPRFSVLLAAALGLIAGVAAKQAVALTSGDIPKRVQMIADVLVLGVVLIIVMYVHTFTPRMPPEGTALLSASLAMWGPKGIAALIAKMRIGITSSLTSFGKSMIEPVEPVHHSTTGGEHQSVDENADALESPARKLRDIVPLLPKLPVDQLDLIGRIDQVDTAKKGEGK